jgi:hypothetical protein
MSFTSAFGSCTIAGVSKKPLDRFRPASIGPAKLGSEHKFSRLLADPAGATQKIVIRPQIRLPLLHAISRDELALCTPCVEGGRKVVGHREQEIELGSLLRKAPNLDRKPMISNSLHRKRAFLRAGGANCSENVLLPLGLNAIFNIAIFPYYSRVRGQKSSKIRKFDGFRIKINS